MSEGMTLALVIAGIIPIDVLIFLLIFFSLLAMVVIVPLIAWKLIWWLNERFG